jgi:hypothetical protein
MAETKVENLICQACGADVRPNALFCYHCGSSIAPEAVIALKDRKDVGSARLRKVVSEQRNGNKSEQIKQTITESRENQPILKSSLSAEPKLKSAATMRRRSKSFQPKRVEIIWEEHENAPNKWFIAAAIFLTLFAAAILYLAMVLK